MGSVRADAEATPPPPATSNSPSPSSRRRSTPCNTGSFLRRRSAGKLLGTAGSDAASGKATPQTRSGRRQRVPSESPSEEGGATSASEEVGDEEAGASCMLPELPMRRLDSASSPTSSAPGTARPRRNRTRAVTPQRRKSGGDYPDFPDQPVTSPTKECLEAPREPAVAVGVPVQEGAALDELASADDRYAVAAMATVAVTRAELEQLKKEMESSDTDTITVPLFLQGIVEGRKSQLRPTEMAVFRAFLGTDVF